MLKKFSPLGLLAGLFLAHLAVFFLFRLILFYYVYPQITDHDAILKGLYIGLKFDGRYTVFLILAAALCLIFPPLERLLSGNRLFRFVVCFWQSLVFMGMLLVYVVDIIVYFYLHQRVDLTLLDLTKEADIGFTMVWQSYPVVWISLAFLVIFIAYFSFWNRVFAKHVPVPVRRRGQKNMYVEESSSLSFAVIYRFVLLFGLFIFGYGQVSSNLFPLRWSNAYFSVDKNIALIAVNPLQNLYDTKKAVDFVIPDPKYAFEADARMKERLQVSSANAPLDFSRSVTGEKREKPLNVVIIMMESWTTPKASLPHGTGAKAGFENHTGFPERFDINPTPFSEELMKDSLYYPNFFANARTTARGILSTLTGIPDVNFSATASARNPKLVDQHIIFNEFKGYERYYMIGGNASWANIRGIFQNNIDGLHLLEESSWDAPNVDVWGISDLALLTESVDVLSQSKKPFIAFIQTAGYHRPFTIPKENAGFEYAPAPDSDVLKAWGFVNEAEYQALRFVDHSIQKFFEKAQKTDWYENTVFILFGDHGTTEYNETMNRSYLAANVQFWHTPFFIHCPKYVRPGINPAIHSQMDIFPTAAQLAGISYKNTTFGSPMLKKLEDGTYVPKEFEAAEENGKTEYRYSKELDKNFGNYAYIATDEGSSLVLMGDYAYVCREGTEEFDALFDLSKDNSTNYIGEYPEISREMRGIADDYYYTSKYLLFHNQKSRYAE